MPVPGNSPRVVLSFPPAEDVEYERNYLKTVVCELKFPTLLELESQAPVAIRAALKREYPHYDKVRNVGLGPLGVMDETVPKLSSLDKRWDVLIRPSSITLETSRYRTFEELRDRALGVVSKCLPLLDTSFFTRVGLRYINHLPADQKTASEWVNPALVAALRAGVFGDVDSCYQEIRGVTKKGRYSLRHGYPVSEQGPTTYVVDVDFSAEPVEATDLGEFLEHFHVDADSLFQWALTSMGRKSLGTATKKTRGG